MRMVFKGDGDAGIDLRLVGGEIANFTELGILGDILRGYSCV